MKTRNFAVKTHLILASLLMPFLLIMPLSGVLHLLDFKEEVKNELAFTISDPVPTDKTAKDLFFTKQFKIHNIDFKFEYIKDTGKELIFRPTSKTYYTAITQPNGHMDIYKSEPNLPKKLIELHKGHGPRLMRTLEIIFGIALIFITLSGVWIALVTKPYRKPMAISFTIGLIVILCALF